MAQPEKMDQRKVSCLYRIGDAAQSADCDCEIIVLEDDSVSEDCEVTMSSNATNA